MKRQISYNAFGEYFSIDLELEATSLEELNYERVLDFKDQEEPPTNFYMPPGESLRFE